MGHKVRWEEMFRDELAAAIAARPVCYLAYGICEPHGLHNALGLDGLKAQALVEQAARAHGGVVAPITWWHISEVPRSVRFLEEVVGETWQQLGATYLTDVPPRLFYQQLIYQLRAVELAGFRAAVVVTGHYGGVEPDLRLVTTTYCAHRPLRATAVADWELMRYKDYRGDHAGKCETSQLWALRSEFVDLSRLPPPPIPDPCFATFEEARQSSRREGEAITRSQVQMLKELTDRLLEEAAAQPQSSWFSFAEAEAIWQKVLAKEGEWVVNHPLDGFDEYLRERMEQFPAPV